MGKLFLRKRELMILNYETNSLTDSHFAHLHVAYAYLFSINFVTRLYKTKKVANTANLRTNKG